MVEDSCIAPVLQTDVCFSGNAIQQFSNVDSPLATGSVIGINEEVPDGVCVHDQAASVVVAGV